MTGLIKTGIGMATGVSPWLLLIVFGLGVAAGATPAYVWEHRAVIAAEAERDQYHERADLMVQDAKRWHDASDLRDASITVLSATLSKQNAAIEAQRANDSRRDLADAERSRQVAQDLAAYDARVQGLEAEVRANPGGAVPVGPIVAKRAPHLFDKDTPPGV